MSRDSAVMYRSYYDAIKDLSAEDQASIYNAIFAYTFDGIEPDLTGTARAIFTLIKPQIQANTRKWESGNRGGRPKNQDQTTEKPNRNQTETKPKPEENQEQTKPEANVNVECIMGNVLLSPIVDNNKKTHKKNFVPPTLDEFKSYFQERGYSQKVAERSFMAYSEAQWFDSKGNKIKNWKQKVNNVWFTDENKVPTEPLEARKDAFRDRIRNETAQRGVSIPRDDLARFYAKFTALDDEGRMLFESKKHFSILYELDNFLKNKRV